jgi:hypothetical protein
MAELSESAEQRNSRFAELDSAIKAEGATTRKTSAHKTGKRRRRKHQSGGRPIDHEALSQGKGFVRRLAEITRREFGDQLNRSEFIQVAQEFKAALVPKRRAGRRPENRVTHAYEAWKTGKRGVALYRDHIPRWEMLSRWRRASEQRRLLSAIHSRARRDVENARPQV